VHELLHSSAVKHDSLTTRRCVLEAGLWLAGSASLVAVGCGGAPPQPAASPTPPPAAGQTEPEPQPEPELAGLIDEDLRILGAPDGPLPIVQRVPGEVNVLRRRSRLVTQSDGESIALFEKRMRETLAATDGGVGLAGPQIGVGARGIVVMLDARSDNPHVAFYINPRIVERSDEVTADYEGCLSIRDVCGLVKRNRRIVVEHGLPSETPKRIEVSDFDARIFQHEIDHLEGVLYIDRVDGEIHPREQLKELREKLREEQPKVACTPVLYGRNRDEILL
jgi:peptide deformylase